MITSNLRFWLKEATVFPIDNSTLAINYLMEFCGTGIILGNNFINKTISKNCLNNLLERKILTIKKNNWYLFAGQG
jgi:hypothetical protein